MTQRVTIPIFSPTPGNRLDRESVERLRSALELIPGVISVFVSPQTEMVYVSFDADLTDLGALRKTIEREGFATASGRSTLRLNRQAGL